MAMNVVISSQITLQPLAIISMNGSIAINMANSGQIKLQPLGTMGPLP